MLNKQQSVQITLLFMIFVTVNFLFLSDNMISLQAITKTSSDSRGDVGSNSNGILNVDNEKSKLINELVKTGKFTKEEAQEFASKVMNNETDGNNTIAGSNVSEANLTANVPVPEANLTANVPGSNISQNKNSDLVTLDISVKQNPISPGEEQSITLTTFDPITGAPLDPLFVRLIIKDPLGNVIKDYTDNDGKLSPSFVIGENDVGTFTILGTALQAGVESTKSLTFQVK